ncbi:hypothetical protein [Acinetobacter baumannii]|uniref:hypothetical protein n=1 Tax=Acinetobacter baumannii TaxID=470 RepID=UPI0024DE34CF|nr:hypothetical protein [Acinetobacter baumannii]MDK2200048.1 hypothetical protein [Acinetobacter baumannii]
MNSVMSFKFLVYLGVHKPAVKVEFQKGLNVIYGASDTGKTFILQTVDFMLGAQKLRTIPESEGYTDILLGIELSSGETFTLNRKVSGGHFFVYDGLHTEITSNIKGHKLDKKHKEGSLNTLSTFLLDKINLNNKKLRKNIKGQGISLSFRNLSHLTIIDEQMIQKEISPIFSGIPMSKTSEISLFNLLLTGIDNSYLENNPKKEKSKSIDKAKIQLLDELLEDLFKKFDNDVPEENELRDQLEKLNETIVKLKQKVIIKEGEFNERANELNKIKLRKIELEERKSEISDLINRFELLKKHYISDLVRLEALSEASMFITSFDDVDCPLCGGEHSKKLDNKSDELYLNIHRASHAEYLKISNLKDDLDKAITALADESLEISEYVHIVDERILKIEEELNLNNSIKVETMEEYSQALSIKISLNESLYLLEQIHILNQKKVKMGEKHNEEESLDLELIQEIDKTDQFAKKVKNILRDWGVINNENVTYDDNLKDLNIGDKPRESRGKGMRSITHAAFTVGLLEYCKDKELPHPGFIILDSPLLAYREPDSDDEALLSNGVDEKFYEYLKKLTDRQVIIIENNDPPEDIINQPFTIYFSKSNTGRYGLFPKIDD